MDRIRARAGAGAFSPAIVFAVLLILVVTGAIFLTTRPDPPQPKAATSPQANPSPTTHRLTDAEAIARFKELDAARINLFAKPQTAQLRSVFVGASPAAKRAQRALHELVSRSVTLHHPTYRTIRIKLLERSERELRLRQTVVMQTETRTETTESQHRSRPRRQLVEWVLRFTDGGWLIYDGAVIQAKFVGK